MKNDISSRADIEEALTLFYEKVRADKLIGHFFTEVVKVDWERHLPIVCDFWENILFYTGNYEGNPLTTHRIVHAKYPTSPEHFARWLKLFDKTLDARFDGPRVRKMKEYARTIAAVMQQHI